MPKKPRRIDWPKIKLEYMASDESLNSILEKNNISWGKNSSNHIKGWVEERAKLHQRILERAKTQIVNAGVEQWKSQTQLWKAVESQAAKILKKHIEADTSLKPGELMTLTVAIQNALKSQKLIIGEPTETTEERSLHLHLIAINKRIECGDDIKELLEKDPHKDGKDSDPLQNKGQTKEDS